MNDPVSTPRLNVGQCATLACLLEVTAPKPGNVHRASDFEDMVFLDFAASATAIGPAMEAASRQGVGVTVWQAIRATRHLVRVNTNLGTVLLLAPLACVPRETVLTDGLPQVLRSLTPADSAAVYRAIRLAEPGGLGSVDQLDVAASPPADLREAMGAAAERDLVAAQYVNDFQEVLGCVVPWLLAARQASPDWTDAIIHTHVRMMATYPDSLIARKCGRGVAEQSAAMAGALLDAGGPGELEYQRGLRDLDFWLRSDGHRRNPGTTADLIAAGLFVLLRDDRLHPPFS